MNKFLKIVWYNLVIFFSSLVSIKYALAGLLNDDLKQEVNTVTGNLADSSGFDRNTDLASVVSKVISAFLALLGIIFVILIIIAGYNMMIASGDEEKIRKSKDTIRRAIIGLIITIGAYAITWFVFTNLPGNGGMDVT